MRSFLCVILCLWASATSVGCGMIYQEEFIEPRHDIRDSDVLVVRFKEEGVWFGDSVIGNDFHRYLLLKLQECDDVTVLTDPIVENQIYECLDDPPPWQGFAQAANADFLIMGTIHHIGYTEKGMVGMLKGSLSMSVEVYDPGETRPWWRRRVDVSYPDDPETGKIEIAFEQNRERLRAKMFRMASDRIGALLCGELVDKR